MGLRCGWCWGICSLRRLSALEVEQPRHGGLTIAQDPTQLSPSAIAGAEDLTERNCLACKLGADRAAEEPVLVENAHLAEVAWIVPQRHGFSDVCGQGRGDITEALKMDAVNAHLRPHPVGVLSAEQVADDFEARFSAIKRHYLYRIINRRADLALDLGHAWRVPRPLDVVKIKSAVVCLRAMLNEGADDHELLPLLREVVADYQPSAEWCAALDDAAIAAAAAADLPTSHDLSSRA